MPSKLSKVHKQIHKKKGDKIKSLHENSRDARRLRNAGVRDDRVARTTRTRNRSNNVWINRIAFIQDHLPDTLHPMDLADIQTIVQAYVSRNDDEVDALKAERRAGRPASTRQTLLEQQRKTEEQEYEGGFWVPNLQDEETLVRLDGWKGDWVGLGVMKWIRLDQQGRVKESQFPPRGAS